MSCNDNYIVKKSEIDGYGIFASKDFSNNEDIGVGFIIVNKLMHNPDKDVIRTSLSRYINHSDNPNVKYRIESNKLIFQAKTSINNGDELTINYKTFPWE